MQKLNTKEYKQTICFICEKKLYKRVKLQCTKKSGDIFYIDICVQCDEEIFQKSLDGLIFGYI